MKRVLIIVITILAVCAIAFSVLFLTGRLKLPFGKQETEPQAKQAVLCVEYMNAYMLVDADGTVAGSSPEKPEGIAKVSGISFSRIVVGQELVPNEENEYAYARRIIDLLKRNGIPVDEVYISSDLEATLRAGNIRIELGTDKQTEEKLKDLSDFYEKLKDLSGTLDMTELSRNNHGYSLKPDKKKKK